jgi:FUN14 family.
VSELVVKGISSFIIGYLLGKGVKILLYILGFFLLILVGLETTGYISVNWGKIVNDVSNFVSGLLNPTQNSSQIIDWLQNNWVTVLGLIFGVGLGGGIGRKRVPYVY